MGRSKRCDTGLSTGYWYAREESLALYRGVHTVHTSWHSIRALAQSELTPDQLGNPAPTTSSWVMVQR